jgi:hypothetical protein
MIREHRFRIRDWHEIARRVKGNDPDVAKHIMASLAAQGGFDPMSVVAITIDDKIGRVLTEINEIQAMRFSDLDVDRRSER